MCSLIEKPRAGETGVESVRRVGGAPYRVSSSANGAMLAKKPREGKSRTCLAARK